MARLYPDPWIPKTFTSWTVKSRTRTRTTAGAVRESDCWDVKGKADGVQWLKRFPKAGHAQAWQSRLERDFASGLPFDLRTKQFVLPEPTGEPPAVTVFDLTEWYFRAHSEWEPRTKEAAARSFNRARRWLLSDGTVPEAEDVAAVEDYLRNASFLPEHLAERMTEQQEAGRRWLRQHSALASAISTADAEAFVARFEHSERHPTRRVSSATMTRFLQPLRACWTWAVERDDIDIDRSPWSAIRPGRKVKGRSTMVVGRAGLAVDADMVLDVNQSLELARACVTEGSWGGSVECFVLVMALCGLRWGEAAGLLWEDVDIDSSGDPGWLTVRRSHRPARERWLDVGEDPEWGPLKDRDIVATRRIPVPPVLAAKLIEHRQQYGPGPDGLVFHRKGRPFDHDLFGRAVWEPARAALFPRRDDLPPDHPRQPKLSRLRRHDLRHAACSWWLRCGVDAVVCQRWSGHKTLSVFLDIYQGVAPGREDEGVARLLASFPR